MKLGSPEFDQALRVMGFSVQGMQQRLNGATSMQDLEQRLQAFKDDVRREYRKSMVRYHPDRNQGDARAEAIFKAVSVAAEMVANLKVGQRPRPQPVRRVRVVQVFFGGGNPFPGNFSATTTSSTGSTTTVFAHAPHVVFRRGGGSST